MKVLQMVSDTMCDRSNLALLAITAAAEFAGHALSLGDTDSVFWATWGCTCRPTHERATSQECVRNGSRTNESSSPTHGATANPPPNSSPYAYIFSLPPDVHARKRKESPPTEADGDSFSS